MIVTFMRNDEANSFHCLLSVTFFIFPFPSQISKLPDEDFWRQMGNLKVLNLHDNGIVKIDDVHALSICHSLLALTLYDTPLSLKPNYRSVVLKIFLILPFIAVGNPAFSTFLVIF